MAHLFTADDHFGDDAIRQLLGRPFASVEVMDQALLGQLQAAIREDDDLWVLGDFALADTPEAVARARAVFDAIPGRKHLVPGNHDPGAVLDFPWASASPLVEIEVEGQALVLCHYPLVTWNGVRDGAIHLFGHAHRWPGFRGAVNVGVDPWGGRPVGLHDLQRRAETLPESPTHWAAEQPLGLGP